MADIRDPKRARRLDKNLIPPAVTTEYINAIGMMFSLGALLMKVIVTCSLLWIMINSLEGVYGLTIMGAYSQ